MNLQNYERLVRELCAHVGIEEWEQVLRTRHIDLDGQTVGLIYDEALAPDSVWLYLHLGVVCTPAETHCLLEENAVLGPADDGRGCFAVLPGTGTAVYRDVVAIGECSMTGADLATSIGRLVVVGTQRFNEALARQSAGTPWEPEAHPGSVLHAQP